MSAADRGSGGEELLYVSWGGTGRAATVREAMSRAGATGRTLVYLAILDDSAFGDLDQSMLDLAREELGWLLDAQLELNRSQTNLEDLDVRVLVQTGDVADAVCDAVAASGAAEVLVGAPLPLVDGGAVSDLVEELRSRVPAPVDVIHP